VPAARCGELRLGSARSAAARAARRPLARRHRRRRLDVSDPAPPIAGADPRRPRRAVHGADRCVRHRHRNLDRADPDRRRRARGTVRTRPHRDRRQRAAQSADRRGSMGLASWGTAICDAADKLRARLRDDYGGVVPSDGLEARGEAGENPLAKQYSMHAYGAQFAEVRVDVDTGEVRRSTAARRLRGRPRRQRQDRPLATARRDDDGAIDGAPRGERARSAFRRLCEQKTSPSTTSR